MFIIKKNQVIITALVVMIGVAGYLNYIDRNPAAPNEVVVNDESDIGGIVPDGDLIGSDITEDENGIALNGEVGDAVNPDDSVDASANKDNSKKDDTAVVQNADVDTESSALADNTDSSGNSSEPGAAVFVNTSNDSSYFVQAKLDREQSRAKQKDILTEMINNTNVEKDKKAECANAMLEIQQRIEKETAAEAMIEAKGFNEVYVRIDDDTVDVVVNKEKLSEAEIAQIEDIVKRKTGVSADKIRISPIKK